MSEKRKTLGKIDFKAFVDTFNSMGKEATVKHVSEMYGVRYDTIVKRLNKESEYTYSRKRDRYVLKSEVDSGTLFLSLEELCQNENPKIEQNNIATEIITNLIKDKFFEISRYVTLENSSRKITLNLDAARGAGYDIEYV